MASYFQSYFQASSMPKRLLQYALSRLEILDTSALGLDNLDIAWGKNSEFVFRDVGLKLRKLENLLQLPPSLEFSRARVLLLRITIPVDIYSSPILVEVDGVECHLRVQAGRSTDNPTSPTNHDRKGRRPRSHASPHGRRGSDYAEDDDAGLPTAADLAQSFLQAEPRREKEELEAAMISQKQDLSVDDDEDDVPVGTGTALSLPGFMTNFLQGIVDRLQVKIHGIVMNLDVDIPNEAAQPITVDPVTVQLRIDSVDIEGVTQQMDDTTPENSRPCQKEGKRLICLSQIRGALISEANLFSSLGRSSAVSSPSVAHSDVFASQRISRYSSARGSEHYPIDTSSPAQISMASSRRLSSSSSSTTSSSSSSLQNNPVPESLRASAIASDSGRFDDASDDGAGSDNSDGPPADLLVSEIRESDMQNSAYLDQMSESQYSDYDQSLQGSISSLPRPYLSRIEAETKSPLSTPRASMHLPLEDSNYFAAHGSYEQRTDPMLYSSALPRRARTRFSDQRVSQSQPLHPESLNPTPLILPESSDTQHPSPKESGNDVADSEEEDEASTPIGEDLAQSQLFSHEEAESMYMSALSHGDSASTKVPSGWDQPDDSSDTFQSAPASPESPDISDEPLDNLEHALNPTPISGPGELESVEQSDPPRTPTPRLSAQPSSSVHSLAASQHTSAMPQSTCSASEKSQASSDDYGRMTKQIISLDHIAIYVPTITGPVEVTNESPDLAYGSGYGSTMFSTDLGGQHDPSYSVSPEIPGAFSVYAERRQGPTMKAKPPPRVASVPAPTSADGSIEVNLGNLSLQFDVSVGRLIWKLVCKVQEALKQEPVASTEEKIGSNSAQPDIKVLAKEISLKFLERLEGTGESGRLASAEQWMSPPETNILLQTSLKGLSVTRSASQLATKTSMTLEKFTFGYAQENIVSFDPGLQMRASVRDLAASAGLDMSINLHQTTDTTRCEISTLPLHVSIDLQRLDETFSWFGGLSSVLNMGSSVVSNATITTSPTKPKPRGVRFEAPIKPDDKSVAAQNKVDARIGGFVLDLLGKDCSVGAETSSVKIVSRDEGIGVSISKIRLSGPHLRSAGAEPAISAEITGTRIEYLPAPKDIDLDRLLALITPSRAKYDQDDDILLDTLLRQRKQGSVLRLTVDELKTRLGRLDELSYLPDLGEEIARLSTVAKYLPDDDRPGLLSLITVRNFDTHVDVGRDIGTLQLVAKDIEVAQITLPSLVAFSVQSISAYRNGSEELIGPATDAELREPRARAPAIMARMIGDEMEPIIKVKLWNLKVEYRVPTLMALLGLATDASPQDLSASMVASVATLTGVAKASIPAGHTTSTAATKSDPTSKSMTVDVVIRDCILGLNPLGLPSKVLIVLSESRLAAVLPKDKNTNANADIAKASILIIDDVENITTMPSGARPRRDSFDGGNSQVSDLCSTGFVSVGYISSAKALVQVSNTDGEQAVDVELHDDLFVLESCADSTQTLATAFGALAPPTPPSKETKYRTKVIPVQDLLASLSGDAFGTAEGKYDFDEDFGIGPGSELEDDIGDLNFDSHYIDNDGHDEYKAAVIESDYGDGSLASLQLSSKDTHDGVLLESFAEEQEEIDNEPLDFQDDHFGSGSIIEGTAHRWNSTKNTYDKTGSSKVRKSPLKVCVRDVHIIWKLFDGYDWQNTQDTISRAVQDVQSRAIEKRNRPTFDVDIDDDETVIGDFLFNSIYIGIPANRDPADISAAINHGLNDDATETESVATTTFSSSPSRAGGPRRTKPKKLRLKRSRKHKIAFELKGVCVDLIAFPPGSGETQSSIDVRVRDFEIIDHIPTSAWRKFATYMQDAGERETGASQIHIEILNVKPVPELAASEIVLKATVLPLRLHVDQDALDFITRFFEFKDENAAKSAAPGDAPFLQRVEVNTVQVKMDFKPKRVDYAGLRSGHTTEFMNFFILEEADLELRHTIIYGISGFDKLSKCLNDIWMPDVKRNQLPGILAGLAPVRSIVNVGGGIQQLVVVPLHEYKKDGRIVRSISKGAAAFAKTTGTELVKLGAKVAVGMQTVLQGAEGILGQPGEPSRSGDEDESDEEGKKLSLYANQPVGVMQGLRGGYRGLQRDLLVAKDVIIAIPSAVMEQGNAAGALKVLSQAGPTVILRPAIGIAKASGQILMGATNSMDPSNLKKAGDKYKSH
ncbi:hypothetical protein BP6252_03308 [Coleophoma cylindrospora]|uniref:Autophagy-related protein 2 n=1 Tax=Coleophoma cylindrospora TaxID=1849047 RepID=A0A3D8S7E3_9HELO|nr:hypothetical protein BP6252_03308 [Coleophoma cylindrospora]